jgi:hypothetical protein
VQRKKFRNMSKKTPKNLCGKRVKPESSIDIQKDQSPSTRAATKHHSSKTSQFDDHPSSISDPRQEQSSLIDDDSVAKIKQLGEDIEESERLLSGDPQLGSVQATNEPDTPVKLQKVSKDMVKKLSSMYSS